MEDIPKYHKFPPEMRWTQIAMATETSTSTAGASASSAGISTSAIPEMRMGISAAQRDPSKPVNKMGPIAAPISKPPPPMPPPERWANAPDRLREILETLSNHELDWNRPPGQDLIFWGQIGNCLYHRHDLMRQAIKLEKWSEPDIPRLNLSLTIGRMRLRVHRITLRHLEEIQVATAQQSLQRLRQQRPKMEAIQAINR